MLEQDGKPAVPLGPGKTFFIPAGTVHNATNKTSSPARVLANYIVEPGKPVATPVALRLFVGGPPSGGPSTVHLKVDTTVRRRFDRFHSPCGAHKMVRM